MSGSGASNLGYSKIIPLSNINGNYVNVHNSHNPYHFSSNEISGEPTIPGHGLRGASNNVDAAAGRLTSIFKGGAIKRKIKNITKKYKKMKGKSRRKKKGN